MNNIMGLLVGVPLILLLWVIAIGAAFAVIQIVRGKL